MNEDLAEAVKRVLPGVLEDLKELVSIPSVSADNSAEPEIRRCAELTAELFRRAGAPQVRILDDIEGGRPAVLAHYPAPPGQPTVLLYAHYDVQPAGDPGAWSTPPFEPHEANGRLYARGSADDKGGIAGHLATLLSFDGNPPVGVVVFIEGEEEIGSPTLASFLDRYQSELAADVIVLADSENFDLGIPTFTTTLRGLAACVVEVQTLTQSVHSGSFGGSVPDALTALCRLLATLHDDHGDVAIDGLTRSAQPTVSYPEHRFRTEAGVLTEVPLIGTGSLSERLWAKPAAAVLALDAPSIADASNSLSATARAKVSLRVAPGDDAVRARALLAEHLRRNAPWGVKVEVTEAEAGQPSSVDTKGPVFDAARRAFRQAYGSDVVEIGGGGSIPFVAEFAAAYPQAAILVTSTGGDPTSRVHGADESLDLAEFERACLAQVHLLAELAVPTVASSSGGEQGAR